jgi:hypothetical protein
MNNLLDAAIQYAEMGWHVFPCVPRNKQPLTPNGFKDATCDLQQIREWWQRWPSANIGVATGCISGVTVVDIDVKAANGWDTVAQLKADGNVFDKTPMQGTPSGGAHLFYAATSHPQRKIHCYPSIDLCGNGGYVLVSPSIGKDGRRYEWTPELSPWDITFAELPSFLLAAKDPAPVPDQVSPPVASQSECTKRAAAYLQECDPAIQGQGGHAKLLWAATAMVHGFRLDNPTALKLLIEHYNPQCLPPWDLTDPKEYKDFSRKVLEARKLTPDKPAGWLLDDAPENAFSAEDIQALIRSSKRTVAKVVPTIESTKQSIDELDFLVKPPGLVGEVCAWINATAIRPQPFLTLACVLPTIGAVLGRRVRYGRVRTNLYTMGIVMSSGGKGHPMACCKKMLIEAGQDHIIGGASATSDSAIEKCLLEFPTRMFFWDEIGHVLRLLKNSPTHGAGVIPFLMNIFSSAGDKYIGKERAMEERRTIEQPCLCLYGPSTPERFYGSLSEAEIKDGWISRFLCFISDDIPDMVGDDEHDLDVPKAIIDKIVRWRSMWAEQENNGGDIQYAIGRINESADSAPNPLSITADQDAEAMLNEIDREFTARARSGDQYASLWGKSVENAKRIALILACGNDVNNPHVTLREADYACRLIRYLRNDFEQKVLPEIFTSAAEMNRRLVITSIAQFGAKGCTKTELWQKARRLTGDVRRAIISDLVEAGEIMSQEDPSDNKGDKRHKAYRYWTMENFLKYMSNASQ